MLLLEVSISFHLSLPQAIFLFLLPPVSTYYPGFSLILRAEGWGQAMAAMALGSDPTSVFCRALDKLCKRKSSQAACTSCFPKTGSSSSLDWP